MSSRMFQLLIIVIIAIVGITPALAQDDTMRSVTADGFSFSFESALASDVNIVPFAGDPLDYEAPGGPQAPYTEFILYNAEAGMPAPESWFDAVGGIRFYPVAQIGLHRVRESRASVTRLTRPAP